MKGLRLGREKTGSSVGKKPKKSDKLIKQKNKAEKAANADSNEAALASPHFVDSKCDVYEKDSLFYLNKRLLGCGLTFFLSSCPHVELLDKPVENNIWGLISTVPPRRANMLSEEEHEELLCSVEGKPSVCFCSPHHMHTLTPFFEKGFGNSHGRSLREAPSWGDQTLL
jgi:hypothetical protein